LKRLGSRRNRASAFKAGRSKAKVNDFDLSDDEPKNGATKKRVSFLKTQRSSPPSERTTLDAQGPPPTAATPLPPTGGGGSSNHTLAHPPSLNEEDSSESSRRRRSVVEDRSSSSPLSHATSDDDSRVPRSPLTSSSTAPSGDSREKRASVADGERPNPRSPAAARRGEGDTPATGRWEKTDLLGGGWGSCVFHRVSISGSMSCSMAPISQKHIPCLQKRRQ